MGDVVVDDRVQVVAAGLGKGLHGLKGLDWEAPGVFDPLQVEIVRAFGGLDARLGDFDSLASGLDLNVCFNHFLGDAVHHDDLAPLSLPEARGGFTANSLLTEAEIADLPVRDRIAVEAVGRVGDVAPETTAEPAVADAQQHARDERRILLAPQSFTRLAHGCLCSASSGRRLSPWATSSCAVDSGEVKLSGTTNGSFVVIVTLGSA